jgi:hypothetical protein
MVSREAGVREQEEARARLEWTLNLLTEEADSQMAPAGRAG